MRSTTTTDRRVLKISSSPPSAGEAEQGGDNILLYVCGDRDGSSDLDLKLIATEGNSPYVGSVNGNRLNILRAKTYHGSEEEWEQILSHVLLRQSPESQDTLQGLEVFASVSKDELTITIRKNIGGITQRLGTISLQQDDTQEIELFDWTGLSAQAAITAEDEKRSLETRLEARDEAIKQLNKQLEDLIKAKAEHENALLEKFSELLNSKKLKIRDQQRLLSGSKVDAGKGKHEQIDQYAMDALRLTFCEAAETQAARSSDRTRKAAPSSARKRKAKVDKSPEPVERSNGDKMDVDGLTDEDDEPTNGSTSSPQNTPEPSDSETADNESETQEPPAAAPSNMKGKLFESAEPKENVRPPRASTPPRRELPFEKRNVNHPQLETVLPSSTHEEVEKVGGDQSGGETDDDEL
ncbi:MAG: hypothetical protein M1816_001053 [Peltula sp. TS41687]|nr:MAG: hypothetical protein M1816_001053 [Peltula sp. TS41687]